MKRCGGYCGVACVDGHCPIANRDEYAERGYDIISNCDDCFYYRGCEDCCFDGDARYCEKMDGKGEGERKALLYADMEEIIDAAD